MKRVAAVVFAGGVISLAGTGAVGQTPPATLGPTASGAVLRAYDAGADELCVRVELTRETGESCGPAPSSPVDALALGVARRGVSAAGGAVPPSVAAVEVEYRGGGRVRRATLEGAYRGRHAGELKFFLVERAGRGRPWLARLFDRDGRLLAAVGLGDPPAVRGPIRLARGQIPFRPSRWVLSAYARRVVAPVPGALDRHEDEPCLRLRYAGTVDWICLTGERGLWGAVEPAENILRRGGDRLAPGRLLVWGAASPRTVRLAAVLGDGRRVRIRVRPMPGSVASSARWFAWLSPRRAAVRRLVALDDRGHVVGRSLTPLPPPTVRGLFGLSLTAPLVPDGRPRVALRPLPGDAEARLLLRSVGAYLCAEIDRPDTEEPSCGLPPTTASRAVIAARGTRAGDTVGGIVHPTVASVELRSEDGRAVRVATRPAGAEAGPWGDRVRVFLGSVPYGSLPSFEIGVTLMDSNGRVLARGIERTSLEPTGPEDVRYRPVARGRVPGGGRYTLVTERDDGSCFALTSPGRRPAASLIGCAFEEPSLLVPCHPRASALLVPARGRRALGLRTTAGDRLPGRIVGLGGGRMWFVLAPPATALRQLQWRDRRGHRRRLRLGYVPPAAKQCGYRADDLGDQLPPAR